MINDCLAIAGQRNHDLVYFSYEGAAGLAV